MRSIPKFFRGFIPKLLQKLIPECFQKHQPKFFRRFLPQVFKGLIPEIFYKFRPKFFQTFLLLLAWIRSRTLSGVPLEFFEFFRSSSMDIFRIFLLFFKFLSGILPGTPPVILPGVLLSTICFSLSRINWLFLNRNCSAGFIQRFLLQYFKSFSTNYSRNYYREYFKDFSRDSSNSDLFQDLLLKFSQEFLP